MVVYFRLYCTSFWRGSKEKEAMDWMEERFPWGTTYGFVMILAYSRVISSIFHTILPILKNLAGGQKIS